MNSVTIPDSVTSIDEQAFTYCSGLTSVIIGNNVARIGGSAFSGCENLTTITCKAVTPPVLDNIETWQRVNMSIPVYVPAESISAYQSAQYWSEFTNIQAIQ
jgi:hypothetical protein